MTFGQKLQKLIDARGYTITYVADCIGVADRTLRNWLHDRMRPQKAEYYGRICDFFRVADSYFMDEEEYDPVHIMNKVKNMENRISALENKLNNR